ncbi:MAG: hypothetical protein PHW13_10960 [Methylococcales bacterium]|nr:hypothetical protein [Methylococcales bacterium]
MIERVESNLNPVPPYNGIGNMHIEALTLQHFRGIQSLHLLLHERMAEPEAFSAWKALANDSWQPAYGDLSGAVKKEVKDALMFEQGYLCCYCKRELSEQEAHIERFRPQSDPAVDALDFGNLLCSCQNWKSFWLKTNLTKPASRSQMNCWKKCSSFPGNS